MKKLISLFLLICLVCLCLISCNDSTTDTATPNTPNSSNSSNSSHSNSSPSDPEEKDLGAEYQKALSLIGEGNYKDAYAIFKALGNYEDAETQLAYFHHVPVSSVSKERSDRSTEDLETVYSTELLLNEKHLPVAFLNFFWGDEYRTAYVYDENDNMIQETQYYPDGSVQATFQYTYNDQRQLIQKEHTDEAGNRTKTEFFYHDDGLLSYELSEDSYGMTTETNYTYDDNGLLITVNYADSDGYSNVSTYTYDDNGTLLCVTYSSSSDYWEQINYTYNADGLLIKEIYQVKQQFDDFEESVYTLEIVYTYDAGMLVKESHTDSDGSMQETKYTYDEQGNLKQELFTSSDGFTDQYDYTYDEYGNVIKETNIDSDGYEATTEITYSLVYIPHELSEQILTLFDLFEF